MQEFLEEKLRELRKHRSRRNRLVAIALALSLLVSLDVFWVLRKPGLTLAGDAECGITEHYHSEECGDECILDEHAHSVDCYSDDSADDENPLTWQAMFENYPYTGDLREDLVGIAQTQVGYKESTRNFEISSGIRHGYTRYGDWYGVPYGDWSAMFVAFCLNYAGADLDQTPVNIGATPMANQWRALNKYAGADEYSPVAGDLVFFKNNTVGIVARVYSSTFYVIRGDIDGTVRSDVMLLNDSSIAGWGSTVGTINQRPPITLPESHTPPIIVIIEGGEQQKVMTRYSLRSTRTVTDLLAYLKANDGNYFFTLLDLNNHELPKDDNGNYVVQADTDYKLTISFTSPEGFHPGTYQYQVPNGLLVNGGEGTFILKDGTNVGDWTVTDEGLITLNFNDNMNSRTDITISATLGIHFPAQDDPIDFDGKITVTIEKPSQELQGTEVYKWGSQGIDANDQDPTKLYWTAYIIGHEGSNLPGSVITDHVLTDYYLGQHTYTQSDIEKGLSFGASEYDPVTGAYINWHNWWVSPDDPNLTWDENGWSYILPETITCQWCGEIHPGNKGWEYYIEYTSTPSKTVITGALGYMNHIAVDNTGNDGWAEFTHGEILAEVIKKGDFISDADGASFLWEFQTIIPGIREGQKSEYFWYVMDYMDIRSAEDSHVAYIHNDSNLSKVTATYNGTTITVPEVKDATADDPFAWEPYWSADHGDGIYYGQQLNILCRCHCNEENCQFWRNGRCESEYWYEDDDGYWYTNGFCQCWTPTDNTIFTFTYETTDLTTIEAYGGFDNRVRNYAVLYNKIIMPDGSINGVLVSDAVATVPIPDLFHKNLTHDFDGYTANYNITINEAKIVLTDGSPLTIHDVMTQTLAYISGSLVITAEDANGNVWELTQGDDFTVEYDGTGNVKDDNGAPVHVLDIVILHPLPVTYTLDYDATLIIPTGTTQAIKYTNSATITLWGEDITDTSNEKVFADINISAKSYRVDMFKTDESTGAPLGGATFGLYNEHGGLITTEVTNAKGELRFQTNIIEGIILREHVLYYMQELEAPEGYRLDHTKYWFCFCDSTDAHCAVCDEVMAGVDALRIPLDEVKRVNVTNALMGDILPSTGSVGQPIWILSGLGIMLTSLVFGYILRRKRERRGDG